MRTSDDGKASPTGRDCFGGLQSPVNQTSPNILANSGGAVATLSFMGAASELRALWGPRVALCAFLLGVLACGLVLGARARNASNAYVQFLADVEKFRKSDISWDELSVRSSPTHGAKLVTGLAIATYACLVVGAAAGAFTVWTRVS